MTSTHPVSESVLHNTEVYNPDKSKKKKKVSSCHYNKLTTKKKLKHWQGSTFWILTWLQMGVALTCRWACTASVARDRRASSVTAPGDPHIVWNQAPPIITWKTKVRVKDQQNTTSHCGLCYPFNHEFFFCLTPAKSGSTETGPHSCKIITIYCEMEEKMISNCWMV